MRGKRQAAWRGAPPPRKRKPQLPKRAVDTIQILFPGSKVVAVMPAPESGQSTVIWTDAGRDGR